MELIQVGEKTYYIKNATNIGIYKLDDKNVYLIDTGNDKDAGKKILRIIEKQGWNIIGIISTHSNADHIGGNKVIQDRTGCQLIASKLESCFIENPILEPSFLYGGFPFNDLKNKFLCAKESTTLSICNLPNGLELISLKGHFFDMVGVKTSDDVIFLADSVFSKETIEKYHVFFIYNVKEFLDTLNFVEDLEGKIFIPSHSEATKDVVPLVQLNRNKVYEIIEKIKFFCGKPKTFEQILKYIFDEYDLTMNANQYVLVGSTIRSYLSYLYDEGIIKYEFRNNEMFWQTTDV